MKRVIAGRIYNTETATDVCTQSRCHGDFSDHTTTLYRTRNGNYFIAGSGGPSSMWSRSCGQNSWSGGDGLRAIDATEAREFAERAGCDPDEMIAAGFALTEA